MSEFNSNEFEGMFDFFILSGFSDGPRSVSEIQQRIKGAERLLELAAARKGKRELGSLSMALERLQREGWLKVEQLDEQPCCQTIYSLTDAGEQRLERERARRNLIVSQFIEDGELDGSFRRFLNRKGPLGPY